MEEYFIGALAFLAITVMMVYVPNQSYLEQELKSLPTVEERIKGVDLHGWQFRKCVSRETGYEYTYFYFPSSNPDAKNMVCIHGFNTDGRLYSNVRDLATSYNLISLNLPEKTPLYTGMLSDFDAVLNDFFSAMRLDSIYLMGVSLGGGIVFHYTASNPKVTIKTLILMSTTVFGGSEKSSKKIRSIADKLLHYPDYKLYSLLLRGRKIFGNMARSELGESKQQHAVTIKQISWYRQALESLYWYNGVPDAPRIKCPVIALQGDKDKMVKLEDAIQIHSLIPHASWHVLPGKGHGMVYANGPEVAAIIKKDLGVE